MPNLVGIGLSQVPTNSMLGGMAYQDPDRVKIKKLNIDEISQINSEIADTAVDVFIYDTSKDSDGGAWRKRTTHTSWYNETLGTATRGTRKEFPAVAVIVTETRKVTIYDGDDPDLPMWMIFNAGTGNALYYPNSSNATSTVMLNGKLANAASGGSPRFRTIDFLSDSHLEYSHTDGRTTFNINVSQRNAGLATFNYGNVSGAGLRNRDCSDVEMTVLPNAPIDDATGLPIPTIAVGTNDGVSIIKDDGTVIDYTHQNASYDYTSFVEFLGDDRVAYAWDNDTTPRRLYITPVRPTDTATVDPNSYPRDTVETVGYGHPTDTKVVGNYHGHLIGVDQSIAAGMNGSMLAVGDGSDGLNLIDVQEAGDDTFNSLVAFATTSYNTGWQHGNIKGTFLSDTDDTNAVAAYYDDFANNNNSWGFVDCSITGGNLVIQQQSQARATDSDALNGIATGTKLVFTFTVSGSGTGDVLIDDDGAGAGVGGNTSYGSFSSTGSYTFTATKTASSRIRLMRTSGSNDYNVNFLNISTEYDRSVNNKGLGVYGTITKSAVATGAELVAYSGFSSNDYLRQPFNSDMEFGTNDYYMSIWAKGGANDQALMVREHTGSDDDGSILIFQSSGKYNFYSRQGGTTSWTAFSANGATFGDYWSHVMLVRRGGTMYGYVNGKLEGSTSFSGNVSNGDAVITIGKRSSNNTQNYSGSLALAKIGQSGPTAEQVKKIYEDEKMLFLENAKATLYGSSDAITGLGYDKATGRLHVGTSGGRSDFQGLRRINNTTTAVTTAISAHDGFIVEQ